MAMVRRTLTVGNELTFEERKAAQRRIKAAVECTYVPDPDCPLLTEEQLAEFKPVNGMTLEERARIMSRVSQVENADMEETALIDEGIAEYHQNPDSFVPLETALAEINANLSDEEKSIVDADNKEHQKYPERYIIRRN
jgi:hypothetical protein